MLERALMQRLDEEYTAHPFYGSRRMTAMLRRVGYPVNCKRVIRLMVHLGWQAIYPKPVTSRPGVAPRRRFICTCCGGWRCDGARSGMKHRYHVSPARPGVWVLDGDSGLA